MKILFRNKDQKGLTSIVIVFILVLLLTLLSIGFTKVVNRSQQSSVANQQATAANYAAQSGINDTVAYLKAQQKDGNAPASATKCDDYLKTGGPLADKSKLSADGSTAYTCVLVDPTPTSLFFSNMPPYKSQIVKINTSKPLASLLFSWQASNRNHNAFVPQAQGQKLFDETVWANARYAPLLRLTLYPMPSVANGDLNSVQANAKTFFLYPQSDGGNNSIAWNSPNGIQPVNCSSKNLGSFVGSADLDCNLLITGLPSGASANYFYARFGSYYDSAQVKIQGNDTNGEPSKFTGGQTIIDVTAKSGTASKRLQARVDLGVGNTFNIDPNSGLAPEFAAQSINALCKRLVIVSGNVTDNCQVPTPPPPPPPGIGDFDISVRPSTLSVAQGGSGSVRVTSTISGNFNSAVDLSVTGLPKNVVAGFTNDPIPAPGSGRSNLNIFADSNAKTGTYTLIITGTGGNKTHSKTVTLEITGPGGGGGGGQHTDRACYIGPTFETALFEHFGDCNNADFDAGKCFSPNQCYSIWVCVDDNTGAILSKQQC